MADPIEISRNGGGVLKDVKLGLDQFETGSTDAVASVVCTSSIAGITFANARGSSTALTIGGVTYPAGQAIIFDVIAASTATIGSGIIYYRYETDDGEELAGEFPLRVYERLPVRT